MISHAVHVVERVHLHVLIISQDKDDVRTGRDVISACRSASYCKRRCKSQIPLGKHIVDGSVNEQLAVLLYSPRTYLY